MLQSLTSYDIVYSIIANNIVYLAFKRRLHKLQEGERKDPCQKLVD